MRGETHENVDWTPCEARALSRMAGRQRARRLARSTAPAVVALLLVLAVVGYFFRTNAVAPVKAPVNVDYYYGGIACSEVVPRLNDFDAGRVDAETRQKIVEHLSLCQKCRTAHERLRGANAASEPGSLGQRRPYTLAGGSRGRTRLP